MSLGTGLFLSSLVMALILLYTFTKDRWRWRRGVARASAGVMALMLLIGLGFAAIHFWNELPAPVRHQTEYAGLRLGMTADEVLYVKGYPTNVLSEEVDDPQWKGFFQVIPTNNLEKGKTIRDYSNWSYGDTLENINVEFNAAKQVMTIQCHSGDKSGRCPSVEGITDGTSERQVLQKLGRPNASKFEGVTKSMQYSERGMRIILEKELVYMLEVRKLP